MQEKPTASISAPPSRPRYPPRPARTAANKATANMRMTPMFMSLWRSFGTSCIVSWVIFETSSSSASDAFTTLSLKPQYEQKRIASEIDWWPHRGQYIAYTPSNDGLIERVAVDL